MSLNQYYNKFMVKLSHIPSGIVIFCDAYRSQHKNKDSAWKRLLSLLWAKEKGIEPSKEVIRTYTLPEDDMYPEDLGKYGRNIERKTDETS